MSNKKVKVPSDLTELFREALINNSYDINVAQDALVHGLETSFAFLYRVQRNKVPYTFFHFETKNKDTEMSLNEIHELRDSYVKKLEEIDLDLNPELTDEYNEVKEKLRELTSIDYGDYFINDKDEVCVTVNHDLIYPEKRDVYIRSEFFGKELNLADIYSRPDIFIYFPLFIVDNELILDVKIRMDNGDTTFVLPSVTDKFVLKKDLTHSYHETFVMFIENRYCENVTLTTTQLEYYDNEKLNKFPKTKFTKQIDTELNGLFFANIILDDTKKAIPLQLVREDS